MDSEVPYHEIQTRFPNYSLILCNSTYVVCTLPLLGDSHAHSFKNGTTFLHQDTFNLSRRLIPPPPVKMKMIKNSLLVLALTLIGSILVPTQGVLAVPQGAPAPDTLTALNAAAHLDNATRSGLLYDVAVIGRGSSGIYAAVRLKDLGKKVAVIERHDYLGGHFQTYTDPKSGIRVELGARTFTSNKVTHDFFSRFNIALTSRPPVNASDTKYLDFTTGKPVAYTPPNAAAQGAALGRYAAQVAKYPGLSDPSKIPYPLPADLLLTFSDFIEKYDLIDALPIFALFCEGWGDFLNIPTVYVLIQLKLDPSHLTSSF